ncbi:MAG: SGNH/GDSL hydrolase family protein [Vicinamibacterales bacterium]
MSATTLSAWLIVTSLAAAQTPAPAQTQPPAATAPSAEEAAARQRTADQRLLQDWPNFARYRDDNAKLPPPAKDEKRVVFMGDSITDGWGRRTNSFFTGKPYVNRGISGQTTPQMLVRFRADVVALEPAAVVILAGINDIAENTGPTTMEAIQDNLASMCDIATANDIRVVLSSVTPAIDFPWRRGKEPAPKVRALNAWMKQYAAAHGYTYLDYYSALADAAGGMKAGLANDGVHPTPEGYAIMAPLAEQAIAAALRTKPRKR